MKKTTYVVLILFLLTAICLNAQSSNNLKKDNPLKGLRKAGPEDLDPSKPIMLDPLRMPMYYENMSKVNPEQFMSSMMSGEYVPEPFIDKKGNIKVFILRKASETEKKQIMAMQNGMMEPPMESQSDKSGKVAPSFFVKDINGNNFSLETLKGKIIVINFWFIECKPCVLEIPELNKIVEKFKGKEVVFLGFANNDQLKLQKFLDNNSFSYNIVADSKIVAESYDVMGYPTHIVIDKDSLIRYNATGLGPSSISNLEKMIEKLLYQ